MQSSDVPDSPRMTPRHPVLRLGQIKGFADVAEVPLAPITLLFAWNSAGKSTILQSLLLLKQTIEEGNALQPSLMVNGSLTQLGSFRNLVHAMTLTPLCSSA